MRSFSKPELLSILSAARAYSERDFLMVLVAYWHGLRASEVIGLTAGSIEDAHLTVQRLKGSLKTIQPLFDHSEVLLSEREPLLEYVRFMHRDQRIFPITRQSFWRIVKRHAKTAGVPAGRAFPHALKHTIAMETIHSAGVENVRQHLGHKSMSSTGEYLKVTDAAASSAIAAATR